MAARYQIWLKDQSGTRVAVFEDVRQLRYSHRVNSPGSLVFAIDGNDTRVALFETDGQVELYRRDQDNGIDWYLEWEGFYISQTDSTDANGRRTFTAYSTGYLDLCARTIVAYKASTAYADKTGTCSTIMREFADENIGPGATVGPTNPGVDGRLVDGVLPGVSIGADPVAGGTWSGARAYKNLLDVLQGMANQCGVDFDVVGTGAATFVFNVYDGQRGTDRTVTGLVRATGLNAAGNAPVVFALLLGNMAIPSYSYARDGSTNHVYVLGQGSDDTRTVITRASGADVVASPWNRREISRNGSNESSAAALQSLGDAVLAANAPRESFSFQVLQVPGCLYGLHYTWGDRVTARYGDIERNLRIVGIQATISPDGEDIQAEIAEVP